MQNSTNFSKPNSTMHWKDPTPWLRGIYLRDAEWFKSWWESGKVGGLKIGGRFKTRVRSCSTFRCHPHLHVHITVSLHTRGGLWVTAPKFVFRNKALRKLKTGEDSHFLLSEIAFTQHPLLPSLFYHFSHRMMTARYSTLAWC